MKKPVRIDYYSETEEIIGEDIKIQGKEILDKKSVYKNNTDRLVTILPKQHMKLYQATENNQSEELEEKEEGIGGIAGEALLKQENIETLGEGKIEEELEIIEEIESVENIDNVEYMDNVEVTEFLEILEKAEEEIE